MLTVNALPELVDGIERSVGPKLLHVLAIGMAVAAEVRDVGRSSRFCGSRLPMRAPNASRWSSRLRRDNPGSGVPSASECRPPASPPARTDAACWRPKSHPCRGTGCTCCPPAARLGPGDAAGHESDTHHSDGHGQAHVCSHSNGSQPFALSGRSHRERPTVPLVQANAMNPVSQQNGSAQLRLWHDSRSLD